MKSAVCEARKEEGGGQRSDADGLRAGYFRFEISNLKTWEGSRTKITKVTSISKIPIRFFRERISGHRVRAFGLEVERELFTLFTGTGLSRIVRVMRRLDRVTGQTLQELKLRTDLRLLAIRRVQSRLSRNARHQSQ